MLTSMLVSLCSCTCFNQCAHFSIKIFKKKKRPHSRPLHSIVCIYYCIERKGKEEICDSAVV